MGEEAIVDRLKLTSPGLLLIIAILASGGIFLLDMFYLQPNAARQERALLVEQALKAERGVRAGLTGEELSLQQSAGSWARSERTRRLLLDPLDSAAAKEVAEDLLRSSAADMAWLTDDRGAIVRSWKLEMNNVVSCTSDQEAGLLSWANSNLDAKRSELCGLMALPEGLAIVSARTIWKDSGHQQMLGRLCLGRYIDRQCLARIGSSIGGEVEYVYSTSLPLSEVQMDSAQHSAWFVQADQLAVAFLANDISGKPTGSFRIKLPVSQMQRQTLSGRRTVLIVLSLSTGLSLLVIVGAHMLITGPVVRLLKRLQRLESGQGSAKDLARDLHGEPLLLARRLESAFDRLAYISKTDQLTGLANRRHFEQVLACFYNQARRYNRTLSLVVMDVDFFKAINDTGGHQAGDEVLKAVATAIEKACRMADLPARFGGDEFAILLPETAACDAYAVAQRVAQAVAALNINVKRMGLTLTISAGVVDLNSGEMDSPEAMMALADRALYAAKEMGRNRIIQAHDLTGLNWRQFGEASDKVDVMCKKLAGLDNQFKDLFLRAIEEMVVILEHRSPHMADHAHKVQHYAVLIAKEMELSHRVIKRIEIAAMLHDIGMIAMPDAVLLNPNPLDEQQMALVRRHPLLSVRIMEGMEFLEQEIPAVRYHHERFDGKGYPEGIAGAGIPLTARILSVADSFDAMTSPRAFRPAKSREEALKEMKAGAGLQFDPAVVDALLSAAARLGDKLMEVPPRRKHQTAQEIIEQTQKHLVSQAAQAAHHDASTDVVNAIVSAEKAQPIRVPESMANDVY